MAPFIITFLILLLGAAVIIGVLFSKKFYAQQFLTKNLILSNKKVLCFLHELGLLIQDDVSEGKLHRLIVDGICDITNAKGGSLYLIDKKRKHLVPAYISKNCPSLIAEKVDKFVNRRIANQSKNHSRIRLTKVELNEGIFGHVLDRGKPIIVDNLKAHSVFRDALINYNEDVSVMLAPLKYGEKEIGVVAVTRDLNDKDFTEENLEVFTSIAEQSAFAIGNYLIHLEATEKQKLESEISYAQEVQRVLLPDNSPEIDCYDIHGDNIPAKSISGDYFDYMTMKDGKTGIIIADVSGKGIPAGLLMAAFRSALRSIAIHHHSPSAALAQVNKSIYPDIKEDMFISAAFVILDPDSNEVLLSRAGHNPPFLYKIGSDSVEKLKPKGLAIGIDEGSVFKKITQDATVSLDKGDSILLYTDGLIEAFNERGEEFGTDRLMRAFKDNTGTSSVSVVENLQRDTEHFVGTEAQADDMTLVCIEKI